MSQTLDKKIDLFRHYFAYVNGELILAETIKEVSFNPNRYDCVCYALECEDNDSNSEGYLKKLNPNFYHFRFSKEDLLNFIQLPGSDRNLASKKLKPLSRLLYEV